MSGCTPFDGRCIPAGRKTPAAALLARTSTAALGQRAVIHLCETGARSPRASSREFQAVMARERGVLYMRTEHAAQRADRVARTAITVYTAPIRLRRRRSARSRRRLLCTRHGTFRAGYGTPCAAPRTGAQTADLAAQTADRSARPTCTSDRTCGRVRGRHVANFRTSTDVDEPPGPGSLTLEPDPYVFRLVVRQSRSGRQQGGDAEAHAEDKKDGFHEKAI